VRSENPIASALMAKMQMELWERPKVKVECLRLLTTLKLNRAKTKLIGVFIDSYLRLTGEEMKQYEREFEQLAPEVREDAMEFMTDWERKGWEEGRFEGISQGKEQILARMIRKRFANISPELFAALEHLTSEELDEISEELFDFADVGALERWFKF
jgi:hypothetical protein